MNESLTQSVKVLLIKPSEMLDSSIFIRLFHCLSFAPYSMCVCVWGGYFLCTCVPRYVYASVCLCACLCTYAYVIMSVPVPVCVCVWASLCVLACACICYACVCLHVCMYLCASFCVCLFMYVCVYVCIDTHTLYTSTHLHTYRMHRNFRNA